ncbi:unnamed protein product [Lactuca saligna]|uniref:F-box domain-containing protein n=1 Tax=Lactuca saligna TaxID=75948 RepID=A0AA35ZI71_LACSI|nr:unnamed protein product [Lactuca saligna]
MQSRNQSRSLTDMPLEVMDKIIVDLGKISAVEALRMKSVCRFFNEVGRTDDIYKHMEVDGLRFRGWSDQKHTVVNKCIEMRNPNILFRNGLMKLFFLEVDHEGKTMLEEASALVHLNSTFVMGMMVMAKGRHRKQEVLDMLNNACRKAKAKLTLRATYSKDECFYYGNSDLGLTLLRQAAHEDHLEAIYLLGIIYISRGLHQCDEGLQLLDAYFGLAIPDEGEYTGVVDGAKELLRDIDVVHRLTTTNITFQCEDSRHSVKGAFAIGHEEDEDRQIYFMVCR